MGALDPQRSARMAGESRGSYRSRTGFDPGLDASTPTDWASVFKPRLGALTQSSDAPAGSIGSARDSAILAARQGRQNGVISSNPLWASFQNGGAGQGNFAGVNDAGSSGEDAQAMFGDTTDGMEQPLAMASATNTGRAFSTGEGDGMSAQGFMARSQRPSGFGFRPLLGNAQSGYRQIYGNGGTSLRF